MINDFPYQDITAMEKSLCNYLRDGTVSVQYGPDFLGYNFRWEKGNQTVNVRVSDLELERSNGIINIIEVIARKLQTIMEGTAKDRYQWAMDKLLGKI